MVLGGWRALRRDDIKLLLAYGTVSQLGMMTALAGIGTKAAGLAAFALVLSHALFKSVLFFTVGIIDKGTGTRDLTQLHGPARRLPLLTAVAVVSAASMAGLPPLIGFVAKESALTAALDATHGAIPGITGWLVVAGLVAGSTLTVAYSARFVWGAFATKGDPAPPRDPPPSPHRPHCSSLPCSSPPSPSSAASSAAPGATSSSRTRAPSPAPSPSSSRCGTDSPPPSA
nr:proton-conducting transporter membrane subunit [Janibacter limosus]